MSPETIEAPPVGATQVAITAPEIRVGAAVTAESRLASLPRALRRPRGFLAGAAAGKGRDAGAVAGAYVQRRCSP